ncbi:hypothetical protein Aperf_G00000003964 [Anoplocephala perfoliata]
MSGNVPRSSKAHDTPIGITQLLENFIGNLAAQFGFQNIEQSCLTLLTNLFISFFESIGAKCLTYAESANRSKVVLNDIVLALVDFGFDVNRLLVAVRPSIPGRFTEPAPLGNPPRGIATESVLGPSGVPIICVPSSLRNESAKPGGSGASSAIVSTTAVPVPPKAPAHLFVPPLPDPHTYLCTKVTRPPPAPTMAGLRKLKLDQRRRIQTAMMHYVALRQDPKYLFPHSELDTYRSNSVNGNERNNTMACSMVIPPPTSSRPYLAALLAEESDGDEDDDGELEAKKQKISEGESPTDRTTTNFFLCKPTFPVDVNSTAFL